MLEGEELRIAEEEFERGLGELLSRHIDAFTQKTGMTLDSINLRIGRYVPAEKIKHGFRMERRGPHAANQG
jgi:hypothetical protein